jgi:hypothetical protein
MKAQSTVEERAKNIRDPTRSPFFRRGFHYYLWLYSSIGNGALASHI